MVIDHHMGVPLARGCHGFLLCGSRQQPGSSAPQPSSPLFYTPDKPRSPIPQEDAGLTAQRKHTEEPREHAVKMVSEMRDRVEKGSAGSLKKVVS